MVGSTPYGVSKASQHQTLTVWQETSPRYHVAPQVNLWMHHLLYLFRHTLKGQKFQQYLVDQPV